jgi:hypothetical protein
VLSTAFVQRDSNYVNIGNVSELDFGKTDPFSVGWWMRDTVYDGRRTIASKSDGSDGWQIYMDVDGAGRISINGTVGGALYLDFDFDWSVVTNLWTFFVATYDGSNVASGTPFAVYRDGVFHASGYAGSAITGTMQNSFSARIGGRSDNNNFYEGLLRNVSIWDKELSASEVTELYNAREDFDLTTHSASANLVGWWLLGDGDTYPTATDGSSSSNDGTLTNMSAGHIVTSSQDDTPGIVPGDGTMALFEPGLSVAHHTDFDFDITDPFSISVFWRADEPVDALTEDVELVRKRDANNPGYLLDIYDSHYVRAYLDAGASGTAQLNVGMGTVPTPPWLWSAGWHLIVFTYDGSAHEDGMKIFIDCSCWGDATQTPGTADISGGDMTNTEALKIGEGTSGDRCLNYQTAIWDKELSPKDIWQIYNNGSCMDLTEHDSAANLVGYWRMGDDDYASGDTTITDLSGNAHHLSYVTGDHKKIVRSHPGSHHSPAALSSI